MKNYILVLILLLSVACAKGPDSSQKADPSGGTTITDDGGAAQTKAVQDADTRIGKWVQYLNVHHIGNIAPYISGGRFGMCSYVVQGTYQADIQPLWNINQVGVLYTGIEDCGFLLANEKLYRHIYLGEPL